MKVPGKKRESQEPHGGKWDTIRYAIGGWGTTLRLSIVLAMLSAPTCLMIIWWLTHR
jgi:hypothetical protein